MSDLKRFRDYFSQQMTDRMAGQKIIKSDISIHDMDGIYEFRIEATIGELRLTCVGRGGTEGKAMDDLIAAHDRRINMLAAHK